MRYHRELRPSHQLLQIKSYSALAASKLERLESDVFQAGDYKWKMIVYLVGNSEVNKDRHISLKMINAQNRLKRFYSARTEWGFSELLSMDAFKDTSNGYLVNDCCTFGAEVFVAQCSEKRECVSTVLKPPAFGTFTWKLDNFSQIKTDFCYSESFTSGGTRWQLKVYPRGDKSGRHGFLSIFLFLDESQLSRKWYAESTLRVKNQLSILRNRVVNGAKWFSDCYTYWGSIEFMPLQELKDATKGYCVNDTVIIECQICYVIEA
ncbi:ubiquitin C-terminal hydrolase 12-like [Prosopis cineraria]|uniref:ubiquitin C-terminal hydrolase 12-like n=1 Tax=Prosopis cineraria TaxID=364024 RepID=UPI002410A39D|nr:ubiquitin C-terminal hydrolase 12-like [Prosopis cineraria]